MSLQVSLKITSALTCSELTLMGTRAARMNNIPSSVGVATTGHSSRQCTAVPVAEVLRKRPIANVIPMAPHSKNCVSQSTT